MSRLIERTDEKPMIRLGDSVAMRPGREPSAEEAGAIELVRAMARNYAALPEMSRPSFVAEVRKLSTGRMRHLTTRFTPPDHPDFQPLMAMLDGLIASEPGIVETEHGAFTVEELRDVEAVTRGRELILFPVRYPKNGAAVFRPEGERGPRIESFRTVPSQDIQPPSSPWLDDGGDE